MAEHAHGNEMGGNRPGTIMAANPTDGLVVACGVGAVRLCRLQKQGKAAMDDLTFLRGNNLPEGAEFEPK